MMKTKLVRLTVCAFLAIMLLSVLCGGAFAAQRDDAQYTNPQTGFQVLIRDDNDLLTAEQESSLVEVMKPITEYGDIIFWSTDEYTYNEIDQAKRMRYSLYGDESSGIFAINMRVRKVTFQSDGAIYSMVSRSYARSITDNVSGYASSGDYYRCAAEAYAQIHQVLQGNRIAEPMKYISFAVIGLMLAFVLVVGIVFSGGFNPLVKHNEGNISAVGSGYLMTAAPSVRCTDTEPRGWVVVLLIILRIFFASGGSSSGGSSSSGGGGGGGGGGGSSSGGGGGGSSSF